MTIEKEIEFDYGHRVPNHKSKCRNLHGHRGRVIAGVNGNTITEKGSSDEGMVIDFGDLKEALIEVVDKMFDHSFVMYKDDEFLSNLIDLAVYFDDTTAISLECKMIKAKGNAGITRFVVSNFIPTAENFAEYIFNQLTQKLLEKQIKLDYVKFYETPTSCAIYYGKN